MDPAFHEFREQREDEITDWGRIPRNGKDHFLLAESAFLTLLPSLSAWHPRRLILADRREEKGPGLFLWASQWASSQGNSGSPLVMDLQYCSSWWDFAALKAPQ